MGLVTQKKRGKCMNTKIIMLTLVSGWIGCVQANVLVTYDFEPSPTASQVDPGYVTNAVTASDATESGDPDGGGSSPDLTNFTGASLNIKRHSLADNILTNFSDYLEFTVNSTVPDNLIDLDAIEMTFNSFGDYFSFAVYADEGDGFVQQATLGGGINTNLAFSTQQLSLSGTASTSVTVRIEFAHASPGAGGNTTLQFAEINLLGTVTNVGTRTEYGLLTYNFSDTPTASKVDPDDALDAAVSASDITEFGDPDSGGSSPDLTNFSGNSLNIKRNALDSSLTNFSDYLTFTVTAQDSAEVVDPGLLNLAFNNFEDNFSLAVYVDSGAGFMQVDTIGTGSETNLASSTQTVDLRIVPAANSLVFRIECAHAFPGGADYTLQVASIDLQGAVYNPSTTSEKLLSYDFQTSPTASQVDPDFVTNALTASDITEVGDPDGGGSSPDLTNFSGASLNIKRYSVDTSLTNFTDYLTFSLDAAESNKVVDLDYIEMRFNNFAAGFSLAVYVDDGDGFALMDKLDSAVDANLANSTQQLYVNASGTSVAVRVECAHSSPGVGGNTTLQFAQIDVGGVLADQPAVEAIGDIDWELLDGTTNQIVLTWTAINGASYAVQSTTNLVTGSWSNLLSGVIGNGGNVSVTDMVDQVQNFYRVIAQ